MCVCVLYRHRHRTSQAHPQVCLSLERRSLADAHSHGLVNSGRGRGPGAAHSSWSPPSAPHAPWPGAARAFRPSWQLDRVPACSAVCFVCCSSRVGLRCSGALCTFRPPFSFPFVAVTTGRGVFGLMYFLFRGCGCDCGCCCRGGRWVPEEERGDRRLLLLPARPRLLRLPWSLPLQGAQGVCKYVPCFPCQVRARGWFSCGDLSARDGSGGEGCVVRGARLASASLLVAQPV